MKISTATSVYVNCSIHDAVDHVIKSGFNGVDIWCGRPHLFRQDVPRSEIQHLREKIDTAGLSTVSLMPAFFRYPFSLSNPNKTIRDDSIQYMIDTIDNAELLGSDTVLVVATRSMFRQTTAEARGFFIKSLEKVCGHAERKNIRLGIEVFYPNLCDYMYSTTQAVQVIHDIGSRSLGIVLDTGHLNLSGENPEKALDTAGEYLLQIHINDNDRVQQQNAVPGEGNFDFTGFISLLRRKNYAGFLSLELGWHYSFDPFPPVEKALKQVKDLL